MAPRKPKTPATPKPKPADTDAVDWEQEARRLSMENQRLTTQNTALRGQLLGFTQMLQGMIKSILGDGGQPPPPAQ